MRSLLLLSALLTASVATAAPGEFTQQGRLSDSSGVPLDGFNTVTFSLHDSRTGGSALWSETHTLEFEGGYYNVILGSQNAFNKDDFDGSDDLFLGLAINGGAQLPDRTELTSVPWAIWAQGADTAVTAENVSGGIVDASEIRINGNTVIDSSGTPAVSWDDLSDIPSDFADGTDDGFAPPNCSTDEIIRWDGSSWSCSSADDHNHNASSINDGVFSVDRIPVGSDSGTVAAGDHGHDASSITDGILSVDRIPVGSDSGSVAAGNHSHNGIEALDCSGGEIAKYNDSSNAWECASAGGGGGGTLLFNYELNENSGSTFADTSGLANDAESPGGGIASGSAGHAGRGVNFTGGVLTADDGNTIPDSPYVTVEAWVEPALPLSGDRVILQKDGAYTLMQTDDTIEFTVTTTEGTCTINSAYAVTAGEWAHVTGAYNGSTVMVSVNNAWIEEICEEGPLADTFGGKFHIGADASSGSSTDSYKGVIDEVRGWSFAPQSSYQYASQGSLYRWNVWSTYNQPAGWYFGNDANMTGGVNPSTWGNSWGQASQMSSSSTVLRTLFTRQGPRLTQNQGNATVVADEWYYYSSTNSKHAGALFRIQNTTSGNINWNVCWWKTSSDGSYDERASIALNGSDVWNSGSTATYASNGNSCHNLNIPAGRTSTAIFISSSTEVSGTRGLALAFYNNSLTLPTGLRFVDDLDTKPDGWQF